MMASAPADGVASVTAASEGGGDPATPSTASAAKRVPIIVDDGPAAVLVLHGLTGSPYEVAPIAQAVAEAGYAVRAPVVAGHDDLETLEASTWRQWYASAERHLDALRTDPSGRARPVFVVGFSMGSLLALRMAALRPGDVQGVAALAVPLQLPAWQRPVIGALAKLRRQPWIGDLVGVFPKRHGPDVRIEHEVASSPSLRGFPYPALRQFVQLQDEVGALLSMVRAPLLLVHGRYDHTAPPEHSERVAQRVSSARVERVLLPRSFHIIGRDLDRERVCAEVTRFVRSVLPTTAHRPSP